MRDAKPLDAGTGRLCASFDPGTAAWLSLGAPHERHGFVELSALPPFDERQRGNAAATRRHRLEMTRGAHAFLAVEVEGLLPALVPDPSEPVRPRWSAPGLQVDVVAEPDASVIRQRWSVRGPAAVRLRLRGRIDRPGLAEITELDPPSPTGAATVLDVGPGGARLDAPSLPAVATVSVTGAEIGWDATKGELIGALAWPQDAETLVFGLAVGLGPLAKPGRTTAEAHDRSGDPLIDRALAYVRGCTALRASADERVLLSDHRILPLSWTRDAYWQALALLTADGAGDRDRVADHLRWLWRRCERPDGRWVRSHHANGRRKDLAFQADQQLYPILELADYWRATSVLPEGVDWSEALERAWAAALEAVDPGTGLIACAENAADDPAVAPYIVASQILLWYAAWRTAELASAGALSFDARRLRATAEVVAAAFAAHMAAGDAPWPYAVDDAGRRIAYHDANDLPVALASLWGFCASDDPGWIATMAFAFSSANPGWTDGGLGSAHTAGAWTLGDLQAWIHARTTGDAAGMDHARRRLE
ncbi:MAG: glycoside hydrolase family 125 protein, partial [Candidatus Limnocylindria bacterium]